MLLGIVHDLFSFDHQWQLIFLNKSLIWSAWSIIACDRLHWIFARSLWSKGYNKRMGPFDPSRQRVQSITDLGSFGIIRRLRSQQHRSWMAGTSSISYPPMHTIQYFSPPLIFTILLFIHFINFIKIGTSKLIPFMQVTRFCLSFSMTLINEFLLNLGSAH